MQEKKIQAQCPCNICLVITLNDAYSHATNPQPNPNPIFSTY